MKHASKLVIALAIGGLYALSDTTEARATVTPIGGGGGCHMTDYHPASPPIPSECYYKCGNGPTQVEKGLSGQECYEKYPPKRIMLNTF